MVERRRGRTQARDGPRYFTRRSAVGRASRIVGPVGSAFSLCLWLGSLAYHTMTGWNRAAGWCRRVPGRGKTAHGVARGADWAVGGAPAPRDGPKSRCSSSTLATMISRGPSRENWGPNWMASTSESWLVAAAERPLILRPIQPPGRFGDQGGRPRGHGQGIHLLPRIEGVLFFGPQRARRHPRGGPPRFYGSVSRVAGAWGRACTTNEHTISAKRPATAPPEKAVSCAAPWVLVEVEGALAASDEHPHASGCGFGADPANLTLAEFWGAYVASVLIFSGAHYTVSAKAEHHLDHGPRGWRTPQTGPGPLGKRAGWATGRLASSGVFGLRLICSLYRVCNRWPHR